MGLVSKICGSHKAAVFLGQTQETLHGTEHRPSAGFAQCPHHKAHRKILGTRARAVLHEGFGSGVETVGLGNFFPVCWCQHWSLDTVPPPPQNLIPSLSGTGSGTPPVARCSTRLASVHCRPSGWLLETALAAILPTVGPNSRIERQGGLFSADRPKLGPAPAPQAHRDHREPRDQFGRGHPATSLHRRAVTIFSRSLGIQSGALHPRKRVFYVVVVFKRTQD